MIKIKHKLLQRQLKKNSLQMDKPPSTLDAWERFLLSIDKTYMETDQDRYTLERSQEVSSNELLQLFQTLEEAQRISKIGTWTYNIKSDKIVWSNGMYNIMRRDSALGAMSVEEFLSCVHPDDGEFLEKRFRTSFEKAETVDISYRVIIHNEIIWVRAQWVSSNKEGSEKIEILTGTLTDITERKKTEQEIKELNERLIISARRAGMAEVASSVLHNVGNVLNSLNVSSSILMEKVTKSKLVNLRKLSDLLMLHKDNIGDYMANNEKGKFIPEYILEMTQQFEEEQKIAVDSLTKMNEHVQHIKDIVGRQQSISKSVGIIQTVTLPLMIEDALSIVLQNKDEENDIKVTKVFCERKEILIDKSNLLQILINLIRNAKDALNVAGKQAPEISLLTMMDDPDNILIIVQDNGVGIVKENLIKIFEYGFTTKTGGSGIGLHASALAAKDLGGSLSVVSEGANKGARFVLKIPYKLSDKNEI